MTALRAPGALQPVLAGVVAALVGFASSFAIVLAGLQSVGADARQAASGLLVLCLAMGACSIALGLRFRMPIALAWSTPGAALLVSAGAQPGGYPAALGAFAVCGVLLVLAGLWPPLGRWIRAIPAPLAAALLAGVLLPVCLAPARAAIEVPAVALPVIAVWALLMRFGRRWAVPGALAAAVAGVAIDPAGGGEAAGGVLPALTFALPELHGGALLGLALPLFVVTMASQNVPGMGVLATFGYRPPLRPLLVTTGAATAAGAAFGGHAINLAAITAALTAGPDAHPDRSRRWIASVTTGGVHVALGLCAGLATLLVAAAPPVLIEAVAGLALLATLASALAAAVGDPEHRDAAIVTLVVSASAITAAGISAPFWGLLAGLAFSRWGSVRRAG